MNAMNVKLCIIMLTFLCASSAYAGGEIGVMGRIAVTGEKEPLFSDGVYVSKDTYGMRANAVSLAIRTNTRKPFDYPVLGIIDLKGLSQYGGRDSVGLFADNTSVPLNKWEVVNNAKYTSNSVSSPEIDPSKIKPGMIIDTRHNPKWSSYIVKVEGNKLITAGWVNTSTGKIDTPDNSAGFIINPITKIWATNFNVVLTNSGRAPKAVIQENGVINNKVKNPDSVIGLDTVILPESRYGGTIAYQARNAASGNKQQWDVGFRSDGAKTANFSSIDGAPSNTTKIGFLENSKAEVGLTFSGKNKKSSVEWYSSGKLLAKISSSGQIEKMAFKTKIVTDSGKLTDQYARYIVKSETDIKLSLPDKATIGDGYTLEIDNFTGHKVAFSGDAKVNIAEGVGHKMTATFVGGEWQIL
ncbi:hypothetical protein [Gibbsiella quercinecans]|uniref:hypothetical protein n=1 Tax=Gibbsiella quercinecans TaxID=929813 RepID=UPI0011C38C19|nr:hypothetical protein [Gibbsiella quercinecans]